MKLKFKHQPFQAEAAAAVCDVFNDQPLRTANYRIDLGDTTNMQQRMDFSEVGFRNHPLVPELTRSRILENLRAVQIRNNLKPSDALAGPGINLTIEMETGTGKTYTYVKTMYELNRRYGWSKFIIVVPSVAIREGVAKSLETTQQHFSDEYGKKIRFFTYSSDKLTEVDNFASDSGIYAMIINMQAFNSSKNQKIIDKKLDSFRSRRPIDIIAQTNPILIIDEPQSVEGKQTKESLKKFNALFTLRYSATHKEKYDMVYRLDAMDAYNQHLVKKIAALGITLTGTTATNSFVYVEGVDIYKNKAPTARLGFEIKGKTGTRTMVRKVQGGDDLYTLSGELDEYADRFVILPDDIFSFLADTATEVRMRIRLDRETRMVQNGALWSEENLPAEAVLWGLMGIGAARDKSKATEQDMADLVKNQEIALQIGGKHTVGRGLCRLLIGSQEVSA